MLTEFGIQNDKVIKNISKVYWIRLPVIIHHLMIMIGKFSPLDSSCFNVLNSSTMSKKIQFGSYTSNLHLETIGFFIYIITT
jgi:hypothetical protein